MPFALPMAVKLGVPIAVWTYGWLERKLRHEPADPKREGDYPSSGEGQTIPVVFGSRWVPAALLWYGDLHTSKISQGGVTMGYKYYCGAHWGVCHAPIDGIMQIRSGGTIVWGQWPILGETGSPSPPLTASGTLTLDCPNAYGGPYSGGGVKGYLDVEFGGAAQTANAYLASQFGANCPAFRGIVGAVWKYDPAAPTLGYIAAMHFTIREWQFRVYSWYGDTPNVVGINPVTILTEICLNTEWGLGLTAADLDTTSFTAARATLESEGLYLSFLLDAAEPVDDMIRRVLSHIQGTLYASPVTGKLVLKLVRDDYTPADLLVADESNVARIESFSRASIADTTNTLVARYEQWGSWYPDFAHAIAIDYTAQERTFTLHNQATLAAAGGRINAVEMDYDGIVDQSVAEAVAARDLQRLTTPLASAVIVGNRTLAALNPGDAFKLTWSKYGLDELIMRVSSVDYGMPGEGEVRIAATEDFYGATMSTGLSSSATEWESPMRTVIDTLNDPPADPDDGDTYLVGTAPTGAWVGHAGEIATWDDDTSAWVFDAPDDGEVIFDADADQAYRWDADTGTWEPLYDGDLFRWPEGTWDDPLPCSLGYIWRHASGGLRYKDGSVPANDDDGVEFGFGETHEVIP